MNSLIDVALLDRAPLSAYTLVAVLVVSFFGCDLMSSPAETVIIVHGTWANPTDERPTWYSKGDPLNFAAKLDRALEERSSSARCWAHCEPKQIFTWSGDNTWTARFNGSAD